MWLCCAIFSYMKPFIDAHCHFNRIAFDAYPGPGRFICNAVNMSDWGPLVAAAGSNTRIVAALGLHPWHIDTAPIGWIDVLGQMLTDNPHAMVGEIGLDAMHDNISQQCDAFKAQYLMAVDMNRPVNIHCVHAWDKMLHLLKILPSAPVIVAHRFSGNVNILRAACDISDNIYFSYRDISGTRVRNAVAQTPLSRILVETDGFAPAPDIIHNTISAIAQIQGKSTADMSDIIYNNSLQVINNGQIA